MKILAAGLDRGGLVSYEMGGQGLVRLQEVGVVGTGVPNIEGRDKHVQKIARFEYEGHKYIIMGRKGLVLDVYVDVSQGSSDGLLFSKRKRLISSQIRSDFFISLEVNYELNSSGEKEGYVRCCTGFGYCYFIALEKLMNSTYDDFTMSFGMNGFVGFFQMFKFGGKDDEEEGWKIVYGGKDRGINLMELKEHCNIWRSKNIKTVNGTRSKKYEDNDTLEEPVWIQDVLMLNDGEDFENLKILAITKFGKLLKYFPTFSKFPIDEYQIFDQLSIKSIVQLRKGLVMVNNGFNTVVIFDVENWVVVKEFQMVTGSLSTVKTVEIDKSLLTEDLSNITSIHLVFISSNVDKFLRTYLMFETGKDNWTSKLMSKQKINEVVTEMDIHRSEDVPIAQIQYIVRNSQVRHAMKHHVEEEEINSYISKRSRIK